MRRYSCQPLRKNYISFLKITFRLPRMALDSISTTFPSSLNPDLWVGPTTIKGKGVWKIIKLGIFWRFMKTESQRCPSRSGMRSLSEILATVDFSNRSPCTTKEHFYRKRAENAHTKIDPTPPHPPPSRKYPCRPWGGVMRDVARGVAVWKYVMRKIQGPLGRRRKSEA